MVHSTFAQGNFLISGRDSSSNVTIISTTSPSSQSSFGIPKSPSFHSGLDLMASASVDSLLQQSNYNNNNNTKEEEETEEERTNNNKFVHCLNERNNGPNKNAITRLPQLTG